MNRIVLGTFIGLMLSAVGLFWLQGRAEVERGAPPPEPSLVRGTTDDLPGADAAGMMGPEPPEATELSREERRFFRYDRNRDGKITRHEMLSSRTDGFRKLDANGDRELGQAEFAKSAPVRRSGNRSPSAPACDC